MWLNLTLLLAVNAVWAKGLEGNATCLNSCLVLLIAHEKNTLPLLY